MSFGVTLLAGSSRPRAASPVRELRGRKGHPRLHHGPEDAGIGWRGLDTRQLYLDDVMVPTTSSSVIPTWG